MRFLCMCVLALATSLSLAADPIAARDGDGRIGLYADFSATLTSATFSIGVPRTLYLVAHLEGQTFYGITGAEFRLDGFPADWLVFVTPNPYAVVTLGDPFRGDPGARRANLAFPSCVPGDAEGRVLLYTAVVIATSAVPPVEWVVTAGDPPSNPNSATPLLLRCNIPDYSLVAAAGESFHVEVRSPQDLDYSALPGYESAHGVVPRQGFPGDWFRFRVVYSNASSIPLAAGSPRLELDANGDGDATDDGEGSFTMSPADLDSTLANGKEYRYDVALGAPPGNSWRYRFAATDHAGMPVAGAATVWRDSLMVHGELADLAVRAEGIRVLPFNPRTHDDAAIIALVENRSESPASNVTVRFTDVFGNELAVRTLAALAPRSTREVACHGAFTAFGFQPVVVHLDPDNLIAEVDETNNVASHGIAVGGPGVVGAMTLAGLPPLITVPPVAPFGLSGSAHYAAAGIVPSSPVRGARIVARPSWDGARTTHTAAAGEFHADFIAPAIGGTHTLTFAVHDGARIDSATVNVLVMSFTGGQPPHAANLEVQLAAVLGAGCPATDATIAWSVANRGDRDSGPTSVRLLGDGVTALADVPLAALAAQTTVTLNPMVVSLAHQGVHAFTAHVDPASLQREWRKDDNAASTSVRVPPSCLDLALDGVRLTSTTLCSRDSIDFAARVVNRGCVRSQPARVACMSGSTEIATAALGALDPGASTEVSLKARFVSGCHDLDFIVDPEATAGNDCVPASNHSATSLCVSDCGPPPPGPRPDFSVVACDLQVSNRSPTAGEPVTFEAWIMNIGLAHASDSVLVRFFLDNQNLGPAVSLHPLRRGERALVQAPLTWPVDFSPHTLTVEVNPDGQDEVSLANNIASRSLATNLRVAAIGLCPPASPSMFSVCSACVNVPLAIRAVVVNDGFWNVDAVRVSFIDQLHGDVILGSAIAMGVQGGSACTTPSMLPPVSIPYTFRSTGLHRVAAFVDADFAWPETNENDNTFVREIQVGCALEPDLVAAVRIPGVVPQPGDTVRAVEVEITNRGTATAAAVQAQLRLDGETLCNLEMGNLDAGASSTAVCTTPWVASGAACSQRLQACADPNARIGEANEFNNCATTGVAVSGETDLAIFPATIRITPPNPDLGRQVLIEVGLYNFGLIESTCKLIAEWQLGSNPWSTLGEVPLRLPGDAFYVSNAATFVWAVPSPTLALRFRVEDVCPYDRAAENNVVLASLPWFAPPPSPVVVSDLTAVSLASGVRLSWRAEPGAEVFLIERREVGTTAWERLEGEVAADATLRQYEFMDHAAPPGTQLEYALVGRLAAGEEILGTVRVVHDRAAVHTLILHPPRPNPFRPGGLLEFSLPRAGTVRLEVFDTAGRRVALIHRGTHAAGRHAVTWDGRDAAGRRTPTGVYFCRLSSDTIQQTRRIVLLR